MINPKEILSSVNQKERSDAGLLILSSAIAFGGALLMISIVLRLISLIEAKFLSPEVFSRFH